MQKNTIKLLVTFTTLLLSYACFLFFSELANELIHLDYINPIFGQMKFRTLKILSFCFFASCLFLNTVVCQVSLKAKIDSLVKQSKNIQYRQPDSTVIVFKTLAEYYKLDGNVDEYYKTKVSLAKGYSMQHNTSEALKTFIDCTDYFKQKKDSVNLYSIYLGIANIYYDINMAERSINQLKLAQEVCNEKKYPDLKFITLISLANNYIQLKQYYVALKYYDEANRLSAFVKKPAYINHLLSEYANLYFLLKQYDKSIEFAKKALIANNNFDKRLLMHTYNTLGLSNFALKNYEKSKSFYDSALVLSNEMNYQKDSYEFLLNKIKLDTTVSDYKQAIKDFTEVLILKDSLFEINKNNFTQELLVKYESNKKEYENKLLEKENEKRNDIIKWQRALLFVTAILSILTIAFIFFYFRFRHKQQKKSIEKEKIQAELKALKAQLDPHFIHNIFQIISTRVKSNPANVSDFLQKTANYFRIVLKGTDKSTQSLEDEISFTEHYLEFQQSLFASRLSYSIEIENDVDTFGILVPAMLLQPFVENSIKHGLKKDDSPLQIKIMISQDEKFLHIIILDNGLGNANDEVKNEKSYGNSLIEKRLSLYYQNVSVKPSVKTEYIKDNSGFKVHICLPV